MNVKLKNLLQEMHFACQVWLDRGRMGRADVEYDYWQCLIRICNWLLLTQYGREVFKCKIPRSLHLCFLRQCYIKRSVFIRLRWYIEILQKSLPVGSRYILTTGKLIVLEKV